MHVFVLSFLIAYGREFQNDSFFYLNVFNLKYLVYIGKILSRHFVITAYKYSLQLWAFQPIYFVAGSP